MLGLELVLGVLVELVHVDVDQELGGEITEWQSFSWSRLESPYDLTQEPENIFIRYMHCKDLEKNIMIYGSKKLSHVAFKHPAGLCVISRNLIAKRLEALYSFMRSFV